MIKTNQAVFLFLCIAAGFTRAEAAQDEYVRVEWPSFVCSTPAFPEMPAQLLPVASSRWSGHSLLAPLRKDILRFHKARTRAYGAFTDVMILTRGHCPHDDFLSSMKAHADAIEMRTKHDLRDIPKDEIKWISSKDYKRKKLDKKAPALTDRLELGQLCKRPQSPPKLKIPIVPQAAPAEIRKILKDLIRDTKKFYTAQLEQYFVQMELMTLDQAFHCREVTLSFAQSRRSQYDAFYDRRSDDLAKITDKTTAWKLQK